MKSKDSWKESYNKARQWIKKQRHYFANKGLYSQSYGFSSSHVQVQVLDYKEGWAPKNWCSHTVMLEKILENTLDCKKIKPVNLKEISPEYSLEGLILELQYFGYLTQKANSVEKTLMLGKIEAKGKGCSRGWDG